jgi:hypothetical protein
MNVIKNGSQLLDAYYTKKYAMYKAVVREDRNLLSLWKISYNRRTW